MKKPILKADKRPKYLLRLDSRTVVLVRSVAAIKMWMLRYPKAQLMQ